MTAHNKEELIFIAQALLAIFISFTLARFFAVFAPNYQILSVFGVMIGIAIIYFSFRQNRHFDFFIAIVCVMAIPFSVLFNYLPLS